MASAEPIPTPDLVASDRADTLIPPLLRLLRRYRIGWIGWGSPCGFSAPAQERQIGRRDDTSPLGFFWLREKPGLAFVATPRRRPTSLARGR